LLNLQAIAANVRLLIAIGRQTANYPEVAPLIEQLLGLGTV
jgi:hypothetical protein